jgi:DNA-binding Lrp family transcriptional regulator
MAKPITPHLDEIDKNIISLLQNNPEITSIDIAKRVNLSQPAIGARIKKLRGKNILATQIGVNFQAFASFYLIQVEFFAKNPDTIMEMAPTCPFIINSLKLAGEYNITIFMVTDNLKKIDKVIDTHFRNRNDILKIKVDIVVNSAKKFILPVDFSITHLHPDITEKCARQCKFYESYQDQYNLQN